MSEVRLTRRSLIGLATAVAGGVVLTPPSANATTTTTPPATAETLVSWINRHAVHLSRLDAAGPLDDLHPLRGIVGDAHVVGIGESAHGTHTQHVLKHRAARFLVEQLGFRTIAWEENWASGVAIDRYVTSGKGDPRAIVGSIGFQFRSQALLDLVCWMRAFNRDRDDADKVRFLGSDVTELRALPFEEVTRFAADVAPGRLAELRRYLHPIRYRGTPEAHFGWYFSLSPEDRQRCVTYARAATRLVGALPSGPSPVDREDAQQHARAILGFYDAYAAQVDRGDVNVRDRYIADTLSWWRQRTGHRILYSAANVHTAASPRVTYTFPPDPQPIEAALAGGHLRQRYGHSYVSIGTVFHTGEILAGWESGQPSVVTIPPPGPSMVDHDLGQARHPTYLLDLHAKAPEPVRRRLDGPATMRIIGSAYDAAIDEQYAMHVASWRDGFDAVFHLGKVTPTRLLR